MLAFSQAQAIGSYGNGKTASFLPERVVITPGSNNSIKEDTTVAEIFSKNNFDNQSGFSTRMEVPQSSPGRTLHEFKNRSSFAALLNEQSLLTWKNSNEFQSIKPEQNLVSVTSNINNFVALLSDGTLLTTGRIPILPPDQAVRMVVSSESTFTALLSDTSKESLFFWNSDNQDEALLALPNGRKVVSVISNVDAFAALLDNGTLFCWGDSETGGKTPALHGKTVIALAATDHAFTALLNDRTLLSWGAHSWWYGDYGGEAPSLPKGTTALSLVGNHDAFAAIVHNAAGDSIISWGARNSGGTGQAPTGPFDGGIISINAAARSFSALLDKGEILMWGDSMWQPVKYYVPEGRKIISITANIFSYASILDNGEIFCWGEKDNDYSKPHLPVGKKASSIISNRYSFAALLDDQSIIAWGNQDSGGKLPTIDSEKKALAITATNLCFTALLEDKSLLTWGNINQEIKPVFLPENISIASLVSIFGKDDFYIPSDFSGIAVVENVASDQGIWQYADADSDVWLDIPIITDASVEMAFTLRADSHLRFVPGATMTAVPPSLKVRLMAFASNVSNGERVDISHL